MNPKETNRKEMRREDMKCEEAAEFVSALCDGKRIPPDAAEHIRTCGPCRNRLQEYAEMETDLLLLASLETTEEPETSIPRWEKAQRVGPNWWQKGWETMRIPRFAFALLIVAVVVLASSLTIVKVRAAGQGKALMLTVNYGVGTVHLGTVHCPILAGEVTKDGGCGQAGSRQLIKLRPIAWDGDRIEIGVRAKFTADVPEGTEAPFAQDDVKSLPETPYWFRPGEKLEINVPGSGTMEVTGELTDDMASLLAGMNAKALALTAKTASGLTIHNVFNLESKESPDFEEHVNGGAELYGFRVISRDGDRIQLGVRAKGSTDIVASGSIIGSSSGSRFSDEVAKLPETSYWLRSGEELKISVEGSGTMVITGELLDYMPTPLEAGGAQLGPKPGELRFADPLLLRGNKVLHDFRGMTLTGTGKDEGIELCVPHDGRYEFSFSQLEGASEGKIEGSRISFDLNGQSYTLLAGAPVARAERIWVLHPANEGNDQCNGSGYGPMSQYLAKTPPKN